MSEISGIASLQAAINAYNNVSTKSAPSTPESAAKFHDMVNVQFNKFADMSPSQILDHITATRSTPRSAITDPVFLSSTAGEIGKTLRSHEDVVRKSLLGRSSIQEVMTAANEAGNVVKTATALRNKFFEALDKIMNMQI